MNRSNMMRGGFAGLVGLALVGSARAATTVEWNQAAHLTDYSNGVVKAVYDASGNVTSLTNDPASSAVAIVGGQLTLSSAGAKIETVSDGNVVISNGLIQTGTAQTPATLSFETLVATQYVVTCEKPTASYVPFCRGLEVANVTNVTAGFGWREGEYHPSGVPCQTTVAMPPVYLADGTMYVEFQKYTSTATLRAVLLAIKLNEKNQNLEIKSVVYRHLSNGKETTVQSLIPEEGLVSICVDAQTGIIYTADSHPDWGDAAYNASVSGVYESCFATNVVVSLSEAVPLAKPVVFFDAENVLNQTALKVGQDSRMTVQSKHKKSLPRSGSVEVGPYGCLQLNANMGGDVLGGSDNGVPITVRRGGVLAYMANYQLSASQSHVILDGGQLKIPLGSTPTYDTGVYVHDITFRDGARISGSALRVRNDTIRWKVEGTSPSSCDVAIYAWCRDANRQEDRFVIDVDDVTGNAEVDFVMGSKMTRAVGEAYKYLNLVKDGPGTMRLDGAFEMGYKPFVISNGTFLVNGSGISRAPVTNDFTLAGGTFAVAAGSSNEPGVLKVEATSHVSLGEDATLSFLDSSAVAWTPGARLIVDDELTQTTRLRFGTSAAGLTRAQAKAIRPASDPEKKLGELDANGYLTFVDKGGAVLIFR